MSLVVICPLSSAKGETFSQTPEHQIIEETWQNFINYEAPKPLHINYFINQELNRYAAQRGYLWPDNQKLIETQLTLMRADLINNPTQELALSYYYPHKGMAPFTASGFRKYYDITNRLKQLANESEANAVDVSQLIESLMFDSYFEDPRAIGKLVLSNTEGPMYAILYRENNQTDEAYEPLKQLCTPTNRYLNERGKEKRLDRQSTIEDIAIAFYTLALMEANHNIAVQFRDYFKTQIETPLKTLYDLSSAYAENQSNWPENRRQYVDQCRIDFESAGRLEVLIAKSKQ